MLQAYSIYHLDRRQLLPGGSAQPQRPSNTAAMGSKACMPQQQDSQGQPPPRSALLRSSVAHQCRPTIRQQPGLPGRRVVGCTLAAGTGRCCQTAVQELSQGRCGAAHMHKATHSRDKADSFCAKSPQAGVGAAMSISVSVCMACLVGWCARPPMAKRKSAAGSAQQTTSQGPCHAASGSVAKEPLRWSRGCCCNHTGCQ